jgi:hypothetical protein
MLAILARFGHVLYWFGCIAAVITFLFVGSASMGKQPAFPEAVLQFLLGGALYAIPVWLVGLACRYVLSGPKLRRAEHQEPPPR